MPCPPRAVLSLINLSVRRSTGPGGGGLRPVGPDARGGPPPDRWSRRARVRTAVQV